MCFDGSIALENRLIVQMSTVAPQHSRMLGARVRGKEGRYVEAPVSGSRQPAIAGELIAAVAGDDAEIDRAVPLLDAMCSTIFRCGAPPNALMMKLAVNTFLITPVSGLAESFRFAERHQLDLYLLEEILGVGPMASGVAREKSAKLARQDWAMHASIPDVLKNSRLILHEARLAPNSSPLMDVCAELFAETEDLGHSRDDMAAVISALRDRTERISG